MVTSNQPNILLDERETAGALKVTPRTLQSWRQKGEGPAFVRVSSRCIRYRPQDLERWAAERLRSSTSDNGGRSA